MFVALPLLCNATAYGPDRVDPLDAKPSRSKMKKNRPACREVFVGCSRKAQCAPDETKNVKTSAHCTAACFFLTSLARKNGHCNDKKRHFDDNEAHKNYGKRYYPEVLLLQQGKAPA